MILSDDVHFHTQDTSLCEWIKMTRFIICDNLTQKVQTFICCIFRSLVRMMQWLPTKTGILSSTVFLIKSWSRHITSPAHFHSPHSMMMLQSVIFQQFMNITQPVIIYSSSTQHCLKHQQLPTVNHWQNCVSPSFKANHSAYLPQCHRICLCPKTFRCYHMVCALLEQSGQCWHRVEKY
jgi:hypothetical protein